MQSAFFGKHLVKSYENIISNRFQISFGVFKSMNVAESTAPRVREAVIEPTVKPGVLEKPKAETVAENPVSPTASQEKSGLSTDLQRFLSLRSLDFSGDKNTPSKPAAYPNAPLYSEGVREADDNLPTTDSKGNPIKDGDAVHYNDVKQGGQNNCFLMASIASIAKNDPQAIRDMIKENKDANGNVTSYTVTLNKKDGGFLGTGLFGGGYDKTEITVPASEILTNGAGQGDNGEVWVKVIESAYAKLNGGTDVWKKGGSPADALPTLTGRSTTSHSADGKDYSFENLQKDLTGKKNVVINTKSEEDDEKKKVKNSPYELHNWHVYLVEKAYVDADGRKMVQLYNPWGNDHPKPIPFEELGKYCNQFTVN